MNKIQTYYEGNSVSRSQTDMRGQELVVNCFQICAKEAALSNYRLLTSNV